MERDIQRLQPGTTVYGSDGEKVGDVSDVGGNYVLVTKGVFFPKDRYIPLSAISRVDADGVYLNVTKDQIESMAWDTPPAEEALPAIDGTTTAAMTGTAAGRATDTSRRAEAPAPRTGTSDVETGGEVTIPVVEEELRVGKRATEGGGVRVTTRVEETPVEEPVTVRDERVEVERRPADRPVSDADLTNVQEGTFEVHERREEPVVDKQARVVEEVGIRKDVEERTETVQDTVRRTDVDIEETAGQPRTSADADSARTSASDVAGSGNVTSTRYDDVSTTRGNEGVVERGLSKAENAAERATGVDLDRDTDVGQRDPRTKE